MNGDYGAHIADLAGYGVSEGELRDYEVGEPEPESDNDSNETGQDERTTTIPPEVKLALHVVLNHVEPGWENCKTVLNNWLNSITSPVPKTSESTTAKH